MIKSLLSLKIIKLLKMHRGEEKKTITFFTLQIVLSSVIGILSSGIDPLFLKHSPDFLEFKLIFLLNINFPAEMSINNQLIPILLGAGAIILIILGYIYTGITDRINKLRFFKISMLIIPAINIGALILIIMDQKLSSIPFLYSALYIWRFIAGMMLLLLFWEVSSLYFNIRQAKRLFPHLAAGGAIGYAMGSLIVPLFSLYFDLKYVLIPASLFCLFCYSLSVKIGNSFLVQFPPRYRDKTIFQEFIEIWKILRKNSFLRILAISTVIFGMLSGIIMFSYNNIVNARIITQGSTVKLMAFQRALATIIQAILITKLLSLSKLGSKRRSGLIIQVIVLIIGFIGFFISMVGVADFTRQVAIALMSPAAMASFAILPSRYRGRAISLNNLFLAPVGMALASVLVFILAGVLPFRFFIYPLAVLLAARLLTSFFVNKSYMKLISKNIRGQKNFNTGMINDADLIANPGFLREVMESLENGENSPKAYLWRLLEENPLPKESYKIVKKFKPQLKGLTGASWVTIALGHEYQLNKQLLRASLDSPEKEIRIAGYNAMFSHYETHGKKEERERLFRILEKRINKLIEPVTETADGIEAVEILLHIEKNNDPGLIAAIWPKINTANKRQILSLISRNGSKRYIPLMSKELSNPALFSGIISYLEHFDDIEEDILSLCFKKALGKRAKIEVIELLSRQITAHSIQLKNRLFTEYADDFLKIDENSWEDSIRRQFFWAAEKNELFRAAAGTLLASPFDIPLKIQKTADTCIAEVIKTASVLYVSWKTGQEFNDTGNFALIDRILRKEIDDLLKLTLTLAGLSISKQKHRSILNDTINELGQNTTTMKGQILEIIETYTAKDIAAFITAFIEILSTEEKCLRLKRFVKGYTLSFNTLISVWKQIAEEASAEEITALRLDVINFYTREQILKGPRRDPV